LDEHKDNQSADPLASAGVEAVARRRLLKVVAYTAPAVVGTLMVSNDASAIPQKPSCPPNTGCQPNCGPNACNPG